MTTPGESSMVDKDQQLTFEITGGKNISSNFIFTYQPDPEIEDVKPTEHLARCVYAPVYCTMYHSMAHQNISFLTDAVNSVSESLVLTPCRLQTSHSISLENLCGGLNSVKLILLHVYYFIIILSVLSGK